MNVQDGSDKIKGKIVGQCVTYGSLSLVNSPIEVME